MGCSNFGSSTDPTSGGAASLAANPILDTVSVAVAPASDTGNPAAASDPAVSDPAAAASNPVPADPAMGAPNADSGRPVAAAAANPDSAHPVVAAPGPDTAIPGAVNSVPDSSKPLAIAPNADSAAPLQKPVVADPGLVPPDPVLPNPVLPDPVVPAVIAAVDPSQASKVFLNSDFESESLECWNGNRTATSSNGAGCGQFKSIGFIPFALGQNGITHSGSKAIDITYSKNEEMAGTNVGISADSVNVRAWYYFEPGFDFGQGMKIGRVSSFNGAKQLNDMDIILAVRSSGSGNQCGVTDMADVGLFFNGAPKGYDWGNAAANVSFQRGRWYAVEYQVVLNNPGRSDGAVRLWVDGQQVAARAGLNIRGTAGMDSKLNTVKIGGWYSNGANGNSCKNPSQPSILHMDDVAIATSYIGPGPLEPVAAR
jgi:polysaccharide lyase-like protein